MCGICAVCVPCVCVCVCVCMHVPSCAGIHPLCYSMRGLTVDQCRETPGAPGTPAGGGGGVQGGRRG